MTELEPYSVLVRPHLTERSAWLKDTRNQYTFIVATGATKGDIKRAIEELFKVKVRAVRTMVLAGKSRRMGRFEGKRPDTKKAIVTLKPGQKIDLTGETT